VVAPGWRASRIVFLGAGRREEFDTARARSIAALAAVTAREHHVGRLALATEPATGDSLVTDGGLGAAGWVQAMAEGFVLGEYVSGRHKTSDRPQPTVTDAAIVIHDARSGSIDELRNAAARGRTLGECTNFARELAEEPAGILTPQAFASRGADRRGTGPGGNPRRRRPGGLM
jgi:leucyl aminopeptidase